MARLPFLTTFCALLSLLYTSTHSVIHPLSSIRALSGNAEIAHVALRNLGISGNVFRCDSSNAAVNSLCKVALQKVNAELNAAGIGVRKNGVLFNFNNAKSQKISTGHSCTVTAEVRHQHYAARILHGARFKLSTKSLTEPLALRLRLPVELSAKITVRQRFGFRGLFKCRRYGRDTYSLNAALSTQANVVIGVTLNPSLGVTKSGDYALVLQPAVAVLAGLENTRLRFRVSGASPVTAVWTHIAGLSSTLTKSVTALFKGDNVISIIKGSIAFDIGVPVVLGVGALPDSLETAVWRMLATVLSAKRKLQKKARGFGSDLEDRLNTDIRRALRTGPDGKRVILIKRQFIDLLRAGGKNADIFFDPPVDRSKQCLKGINRLCSECRGCSECVRQWKICTTQSAAMIKYKPMNLIHSRPKVVANIPVPKSPAPRPRPVTRPSSGCRSFICQIEK